MGRSRNSNTPFFSSLLGSGYAQCLGDLELPKGAELAETRYGEPAIFYQGRPHRLTQIQHDVIA